MFCTFKPVESLFDSAPNGEFRGLFLRNFSIFRLFFYTEFCFIEKLSKKTRKDVFRHENSGFLLQTQQKTAYAGDPYGTRSAPYLNKRLF